MKKYDVIVIGSGAGNIIIEEALLKGLKCALIEKDKFGGTCLTRGCIPTKVLATTADKIVELNKLNKIGIEIENYTFDWEKISNRVWEKINESQSLKEFFKNEKNLDVYEGAAFFKNDNTLQVNLNSGEISEELTADKIFIGVGSRTNVPKIKGLEETSYITSESFFGSKYPQKPYSSLTIIGSGAIGMEFAHIFNSFGTKVNILVRGSRVLSKEDEEIASVVAKRFEERGINIIYNCDFIEAKMHGIKKMITVKDKVTGEEKKILSEEILVASGVKSNADLIKIENTSVKTDDKNYIVTNEFLETSAPNIYAFGDINGIYQLRHKANYEADILAYNHFISNDVNDLRFARYDNTPSVTFISPQVANVGLTEKQAISQGYEIEVGKHYYNQTAKGFSLGYSENDKEFAKVIIDKKSKKILGFHAVGYEASLLIQPFLNMMNAGKTYVEAINEEISSEKTKEARKNKLYREMNPNLMSTIRETMVPHPALNEVGIWTFYHLK